MCCVSDRVCELIVILLLNVMEVLSVVEVLCWIDLVWSSKECVCCACDPNVYLDTPSIDLFVFVYFGRYLLI